MRSSANMMGRLIALAVAAILRCRRSQEGVRSLPAAASRISTQKGAKGYQFGANRAIAGILIQMGDIAQAEAYLRRSQPLLQEARTSGHPMARAAYNTYGQNWEAEIELGRAMLFEARGQFRDAEAAYKLGELRKRAAIKAMLGSENPPSEVQPGARGRLHRAQPGANEGAAGTVRARPRSMRAARCCRSLKNQGKYNAVTPRFIAGLADILVEQGRYAEAEQLARVSLEISRTRRRRRRLRHRASSSLSQLGGILNLQRKGRKRSRSMRRSTRRSPNGSRRGGRPSNSTARASTRSMPRARSRPASPRPNNCVKRRSPGSAKTISIPPRRAARWRSA